MHFTNTAVAQVFSEYERRTSDEQTKIAALGNTMLARRDPTKGIFAADDIIEPPMWREDARMYRSAVGSLPGMQSALIPIGNGIELSVKWSAANTKP